MRRSILAFALLTILASISVTDRASTAASAVLADDEGFEKLQQKFQRLHRALVTRRGITEEDHSVISDVREQFARFSAQNPGHEGAIAGELQLSLWLDDHDRVDSLFQDLITAAPDNPEYGLSWIAFLERTERSDRIDAVYDWLLQHSENTQSLRIGRARMLRERAQYADAIALLHDSEFDDETVIDGARLLAECLYAENRFDETIAVLEGIDEDVLESQRVLKTHIDQRLRDYREYAELWVSEQEIRSSEAAADDLPRVELITARGRIVLELFEENAPNTVANFITLVDSGFYDTTHFHRIERDFVTQGGDPNTKPGAEGVPGQGGPGYRIADEWERENARKHFAGSLAMAHSGPDTAGSQFYITHRPTSHLNTGYTVFGRVVEGLEIARNMQVEDELESARVLRKRDHEYEVEKLRTVEEVEEELAVPDFLRRNR